MSGDDVFGEAETVPGPAQDQRQDKDGRDAHEAAEEVVLEPLADYPHIDLRTGGEPWDKRRAAGKRLREAV
ncbi:hypothetical protein FV222_10605, partial [Methylobacterium sp. WL103]|uniref:hypothetical protein n=1 Tax=Methylobacterium sp. WL103 TaxID=2603891 RepID=UPI0011C90E89